MPTAFVTRWLVGALLIVAIQACASRSSSIDAPFEISEDYANNVIRYTVQRGDRLSDIALEFTGNLNSWLPIAEHNGITDPRALRVGSQIEIPTALIPGYDAERLNRQNRRNEQAASEPTNGAPEQSPDPGVVRGTEPSDPRNASAPLTAPTTDGAVTDPADLQTAPSGARTAQVRVIGSYYPKGVYARPSLDAALTMRVAPGADFALIEQLDGWYHVETDLGPGFLRAGDARLINTGP